MFRLLGNDISGKLRKFFSDICWKITVYVLLRLFYSSSGVTMKCDFSQCILYDIPCSESVERMLSLQST